MKPHDDALPIPHKCNIWDYCTLSEDYMILFCAVCHKVIGYQKGNIRYITNRVDSQYDIKEFSEETLKDNV